MTCSPTILLSLPEKLNNDHIEPSGQLGARHVMLMLLGASTAVTLPLMLPPKRDTSEPTSGAI